MDSGDGEVDSLYAGLGFRRISQGRNHPVCVECDHSLFSQNDGKVLTVLLNMSLMVLQFAPKNSPFILPSIDRGAMIILPPRLIKAVYSLPESVLDIHATQSETIQTKWTVWDKEVADNDFQINVVRHQITRNLETLTPLMADELERGFDRWWGSEVDGEWKEVKVWDACLKLIAGASNGAFCGAPLCKIQVMPVPPHTNHE